MSDEDPSEFREAAWRRLADYAKKLRAGVGKWKGRSEARDLDLPRIHWGKEKSTERLLRRLNKEMKKDAQFHQWILRNNDLDDDPRADNESRYQRHHLNELLDDLLRSIDQKNLTDTDSCYHEIFSLCEDLSIRLSEDAVEDVEAQLEILENVADRIRAACADT